MPFLLWYLNISTLASEESYTQTHGPAVSGKERKGLRCVNKYLPGCGKDVESSFPLYLSSFQIM